MRCESHEWTAQKGVGGSLPWRGRSNGLRPARRVCDCIAGSCFDRGWHLLLKMLMRRCAMEHGGIGMKVVVWKSPSFLKGLLRLLFGIKRGD